MVRNGIKCKRVQEGDLCAQDEKGVVTQSFSQLKWTVRYGEQNFRFVYLVTAIGDNTERNLT